MTLSLIIKNDGNQPGDVAVFKGIRTRDGHVSLTGNPDDLTHLALGEEITVYPPCGHFDEFLHLSVKGKH